MNAPNMQGWTFDARTVAPQVGIDPVPEGWYKIVIDKTNTKPSRTNPADTILELQCKIIEGQFAGRVVFWNLNLWHTTSQQAVEIAYKQLSAVSHVTGQFQLAAQPGADAFLPMLHNIPFYLHVIVAKGNQGDINNVKGVKDINGNEPGKQGAGPPMQQPGGFAGPAPQVQQAGAPQGGWSSGPAPAPAAAPQSSFGAPAGYTPGPAPGAPQGGAPQWGPQQAGPAPGAPAAPPAGGQWGPNPGQQPQQQPQGGYQQPGAPQQGYQQPAPQPQQQYQQPQPGYQQPGPGPAGGPPQGAPSWGPPR